MDKLQNRIETILDVFNHWLSDDNEYLLRAVHKTAEEGYFNFSDIQFALKALKEGLSQPSIAEWVHRSGLSDKNNAQGKNVLCLHAGNLPLVGFQDALAVLLSGARYTGKISRQDPYLLPTFLNEVKKTKVWTGEDVQWSHHLDDFEGMQNDMMLFAGSQQSVPGVKAALKRLNLKKRQTKCLIRSAHFSLAYFETADSENIKDLTASILRYGGKGCRSVALVVSPIELDKIKDKLENAFSEFWNENPLHKKPDPKLRQRYAYNEAIERNQLWLNNFLLQEDGMELDQDFICYWIKGDHQKAAKVASQYKGELQSIYIPHPGITIDGYEERTELLKKAQQPPVFWKADGTDVLQWLIENP